MSTGRIGLGFSVNNFPVSENFDIRVNIREDFNYLRYGSSFGLENVGVSYLDSEPISVNNNIIIKDLTSAVPENAPLNFIEEVYNSQNVTLNNSRVLITDVFKTTSLNEQEPLYYRHDLSAYSSISEVEVLDGNFNPVNADLYHYYDETATLGYEARYVYTNLRQLIDTELNTYTVYYVRFKNLSTNNFETILLNSKPFYEQITFASPTTVRAFTVTPDFGTAQITIHFDSRAYSPTPIVGSHRFSIKTEGDDRIQVVLPPDLPSNEKWYLRINPGDFFKATSLGETRYYVPEYEQQLFSPVLPYKLLAEKEARVLSSRIIHVEPKPIANLQSEGFYVYVILRNRFGETVRALTNDPTSSVYTTPDGTTTDIFFELDMIQSIAENDGFIRLNTDIDTELIPYVTYRYVEDYYTYRAISVNSAINPRVLNNRVVVYVKPEAGFSLDRTIFHLLVDESGLILESNETPEYSTAEGIATNGSLNTLVDTALLTDDIYTGYELEILSGLNAGRKLKVTAYNGLTKTITVAEDFETILLAGTRYRVNKKMESYSYLDPISGTNFVYDGWSTTFLAAPYHNILLADVFVVQTVAPEDINITDVRIRGGGLNEDQLEASLKLQDQVQWYWDVGFWDGQPYPGMGAILINLPRSILKEVGGDFSRKQVEDIVSKHIASGTYPIIKYYDKATIITDVRPGNQVIGLSWLDVNAGSYNVYLGENPDQLTLYRAVAGVITELDITGLDNYKVYYVMVESVVGGVVQLPSRTAFAIPFNPTTAKDPAVYGETQYAGGTYSG